MREVDSAIWTSGDPVSLSPRLCSAISLPLTSFSTAKLDWRLYGATANPRRAGGRGPPGRNTTSRADGGRHLRNRPLRRGFALRIRPVPRWQGFPLRTVFDRSVGPRIRAGAPLTGAVDHDRVRVAHRVVARRHQLD